MRLEVLSKIPVPVPVPVPLLQFWFRFFNCGSGCCSGAESNLADLVVDAMVYAWQHKADYADFVAQHGPINIALSNPGGYRVNLPAGDITYEQVGLNSPAIRLLSICPLQIGFFSFSNGVRRKGDSNSSKLMGLSAEAAFAIRLLGAARSA